MTRKEQNKILHAKIESNVNQYKVDRLNAEISAFSSGDLNKYEFLTRKDSKYKPNALDKARFEFSPLGQTFSTGVDKNVKNYQEEGVIKLLKFIRDGLRANVNRLDDNRPDTRPDRPDNRPDNRPDRPDDNDDNDNNDDNSMFPNNLNNLNTNLNNIQNDGEYYARLIDNQNVVIKKLEEEIIYGKNLNKDIIDQIKETIDENNKERLKYYNKYKNTLVGYTKALKQLNKVENTYGREIGNLNNTINELRNKIQNLEDAEKKSLEAIHELSDKLDELENKNISENDKEILQAKIDDLINNNNNRLENFIENYNDTFEKNKYEIYNELNKFNNNMKDEMYNFHKKFMIQKDELQAKLDKLNNYAKKLNNYIRENNNKIINKENKLDNANNEYNNLLLEYNRLNEELHKTKNNNINEKNKLNKKIKKLKDELDDKEFIIIDLKDDVSDLKNKKLLIRKQNKETEIIKKQLNKNEEYFNNEEKKELKKVMKIKDISKK